MMSRRFICAALAALVVSPLIGETKELTEIETVADGVVSFAASDWRGEKVAVRDGFAELAYAGDGKQSTVYEVAAAVSADWRGRRVTVELDLENASAYAFGNRMSVEQYDAAGKRLNEDMVDPRFITQMRPTRNRHVVRSDGSVHPRAVRAVLRALLGGQKIPGVVRPSYALRVHGARIVPAAPVRENPAFFTDGVAGRAFDFHDGRAMGFPVYSRACWGQGMVVTETDELFYPTADGTVEAWVKSEDGADGAAKTIFEAANFAPGSASAHLTRGALMATTWQPAKGAIRLTLKGTDGKVFSAEGPAKLGDGAWHHVAVTFAPAKTAAIFLDGRRIGETSLAGWKPPRTGVEREGAMMFFLGADYTDMRRGTDDPATRNFLHGAVDSLRISSVVRYADAFAPEKAFALDADTRALFDFDREIDGRSAGGGGLVECAVVAKVARDAGSGAKCRSTPESPIPFVDPPPFDVFNYRELPSADDFAALRRVRRRSFVLKSGETANVTAAADAVADFTEIANVGSAPLVAPLVIAPGEVDVRAYDKMEKTLKLEGLGDREKVDRIFQFLIRASDYFIWHPAVVPPYGSWGEGQNNHPLKLLNAYCGCACGGLNNMTACAFVQAGHVPADRVKGYGHEFESCLYDGKTRLYDLSGQQFFRSLADGEPASLQDVDREYGLHARYWKNPDHFSRLFAHAPMAARPYYDCDFLLTLSPGESFRWYRRNDGTVNDVFYAKGARGRPQKHPLNADAPEECLVRDAYLSNRSAPDLSNGFLRFDGAPNVAWPAFANSDDAHLVYTVDAKYTVVRGEYRAELKRGGTAPLEWSIDGRKNWHPLSAEADGTAKPDYAIRGRSFFFVRARAKPSDVAAFHALSEVQMNPRVLTGLVKGGANALQFVADSAGPARVTVGWRENAAPVAVANTVCWGTVRGAERMLAALDPAKVRRLKVDGLKGPDARAASLDSRLSAKLEGGELILSSRPTDMPYIAAVRLESGGAVKTLSVVVGTGAQLKFANAADPAKGVTMFRQDEKTVIEFDRPDAGQYFVFNLQRMEGGLPHTQAHRRVLYMPDAKAKKRKDRKMFCGGGTGGSDFYKAQYGAPGGRGNYRWDFPSDPATRYPTEAARRFDAAELDRGTFVMNGDVKNGFELFAALVVPTGDFFYREKLRHLLIDLNHDPDLSGAFAKK